MNQYYLYLDHTTWLHQLDSRTKILSFLGLCIMALTFSDPLFLVLPLVALIILFQATGCMKNLRTIWILLTLLFLYCVALWPFFVGGQTVLFSIGNHPITREGLLFACGDGTSYCAHALRRNPSPLHHKNRRFYLCPFNDSDFLPKLGLLSPWRFAGSPTC